MLVMLMLMIKKMQAIYWEMFFQLRRQNLVFGRRVHYFIAAQGFLSTIGHEQIFCVCMCVCACSFSGPELNLPPQAFVDVLPQLKVWYILLRFFFCPLLWRDRNPSEGKIKHDCYPGPTSESVQKFQISCKSEWALRSLVNSQIFYIFFFFCVSFTIFSWAFYGPHSHPCTLKYLFLSF